MACKTNNRTYKKRVTKKVSKGGNLMCDMLCTGNKKSNEEEVDTEPVDDADEPEDTKYAEEPEEADETGDADEVNEPKKENTDDADESRQFGSGGKKSRKNKGYKKLRKTAKKLKSAWIIFVKDIYKKNKLKIPMYIFKDALKDAARLYKK